MSIISTRATTALIAAAGLLLATVSGARAQSVFVAGQYYSDSSASGVSRLGILDLSTGSITGIGQTSTLLSGLAIAADGTLYGAGNTTGGLGVLYRVNRSTAALTQLATFDLRASGNTTAATLAGIAFRSDGTLYGLVSQGTTTDLARFGNLTGTPTASVSAISPAFSANGGLAGDGSGNLYATQGDTTPDGSGSLYQITPGTTPSASQRSGDPGFAGYSVFALSYSSSQLFGIDNGGGAGPAGPSASYVYNIDPATGNGSPTIATFDAASGTGVWNVYAASNATPEPTTVSFAVLPLLGGVLLRCRRRRRA